jgi:hypothetical protein
MLIKSFIVFLFVVTHTCRESGVCFMVFWFLSFVLRVAILVVSCTK